MAGPIAVLGAGGAMGFPIARNLALAGMDVRGWNRSGGKAEPLKADGVSVVESPAEAAAGASVVVTMLADVGAVVTAMTEARGALPVMGDSSVWVQMSTIGEAGTERCARLAAQHGVGFVDAPVLGSRQPAQEHKLVILGSGPGDLRPLVQPVFDAVGQRTMWVGDAGAGTRLKLVVNNWVLTVVEGAAETIAFAEGLGLDPALFFDAIAGGTLDLPYLRLKGTAMMERDFSPSFSLTLAAKDASLMCQSAERHNLDLPLINAIWRRMSDGAKEHGDEDFSATYLTSTPQKAG